MPFSFAEFVLPSWQPFLQPPLLPLVPPGDPRSPPQTPPIGIALGGVAMSELL